MTTVKFRADTIYRTEHIYRQEIRAARRCRSIDTPECKEKVAWLDGIVHLSMSNFTKPLRRDRAGFTIAQRDLHSSELAHFKNWGLEHDFDGDHRPDGLIVIDAWSRGASAFVICILPGHPLRVPDDLTTATATILFIDKPALQVSPAKAIADDDFSRFEQTAAEVVARTDLHVEFPSVVGVSVLDINDDGVDDIEINTGRKVKGKHEFIQFLSQRSD